MKLIIKIKKVIKKIYYSCYIKYKYIVVKTYEKRKMKDFRRKKLYSKISYTKEQENQIQNFYKKNYGKKIDLRWHKLYQSFTGNYDYKYFPEIIFSSQLESLLSNRNISRQMTDKSMVELLYRNIDGLFIPKTVVLNCSGIYYDSNRNIISKQKAISKLYNCGKKVIKKIVDSSSGKDVLIVDIKDGYDIKNNISLNDLLSKYQENYIVQDLVKNSDELSKLYPKALNTFRVITYVVDGNVFHMPITLRLGQGNSEVDNIHAGGIFVGVSDDGKLMDNAYTEFQDIYSKHPDTKVPFKGYQINGIDKMIDIAYKCHGRTPHLGIISWDFTINDNNQITLIEVNLNGQAIWLPQMANGKSAFGENTAYMLNLLKNLKNK